MRASSNVRNVSGNTENTANMSSEDEISEYVRLGTCAQEVHLDSETAARCFV